MKIKVLTVDEDSGRVDLEIDDEAMQALIERGFNEFIHDGLKIEEKQDDKDD